MQLKEYAFDIKLTAVCRVRVESEDRARELIDLYCEEIENVLRVDWHNDDEFEEGEYLEITTAGITADEPDLFEVDDKEP